MVLRFFLVSVSLVLFCWSVFAYPADSPILSHHKFLASFPQPVIAPMVGGVFWNQSDKDPVSLHVPVSSSTSTSVGLEMGGETGSSPLLKSQGSSLTTRDISVIVTSSRRYNSLTHRWEKWVMSPLFREKLITSWISSGDKLGVKRLVNSSVFFSPIP